MKEKNGQQILILLLALMAITSCHYLDRSIQGGLLPNPDIRYHLDGPWSIQFQDGTLVPGVDATHHWGRGDQDPYEIATLRKEITLPEDWNEIVLWMPTVLGAYRVGIDGQTIGTQGVFLPESQESVTDYRPSYHRFSLNRSENTTRTFELSIQISNSQDHSPGLTQAPILGTPKTMEEHSVLINGWEGLLLGSMLFMGFFHFSLFLRRQKDSSNLLMGFMALGVTLRALLMGPRYLHTWLNFFPSEFLIRIEFASVVLLTLPFVHFLKSFQTTPFHTKFIKGFTVFSLVWLLVVLFVPVFYYGPWTPVYEAPLMIVLIYQLILFIPPLFRGKPGGVLFFLSLFSVLVFAVNDILFEHKILQTGFFLPIGFLVFLVFQSFRLSRESSIAYQSLEEYNTNLKTLESMRSQFLANVSHELRTPVHGILGIARSLLSGDRGILESSQKEDLGALEALGSKLHSLVSNLLDFSTLGQGSLKINPGPTHLWPVMESLKNQFSPRAASKGLEFVLVVPKDLPMVHADESRLTQILILLLDNAVRYTSSGRILLDAALTSDSVVLNIHDTGPGIPKENLAMAKKAFSRFEDPDTQLQGGCGLGLPLALEIAALMKIKVDIHSHKKEGTRVQLVFTLADKNSSKFPDTTQEGNLEIAETSWAQQPSGILSETKTPEYSTQDISSESEKEPTILMVDDEPINLRVLSHVLEKRGYKTLSAANGTQALEVLERKKVDLVFLDIMMPGLSGYDVLEKTRESLEPGELPVIMLSAKNSREDRIKAFELGANDYLVKPFERDELMARMKLQLSLSQRGIGSNP